MKGNYRMDDTLSDAFDWQELESSLPPTLPEGFTATGTPVPLLSVQDGWWIVMARNTDDEFYGMLLFEEKREILFLVSEEVITVGAWILSQLSTLIEQCDPSYVQDHGDEVDALRTVWWNKETEKTRRLEASLNPDGESEDPMSHYD